MRQAIPNKPKEIKPEKERVFKELDGSGLETFFRVNILEKMGLEYKQQFEAKPIGRFYDFLLTKQKVLIEIQGTYYHCDPDVYDKPINKMQKHNKRVDEIKRTWALMNGFVLLTIWEKDIKSNPDKVIKYLNERLFIQDEKLLLEESKKNGTFYIKKKK